MENHTGACACASKYYYIVYQSRFLGTQTIPACSVRVRFVYIIIIIIIFRTRTTASDDAVQNRPPRRRGAVAFRRCYGHRSAAAAVAAWPFRFDYRRAL